MNDDSYDTIPQFLSVHIAALLGLKLDAMERVCANKEYDRMCGWKYTMVRSKGIRVQYDCRTMVNHKKNVAIFWSHCFEG